MAGVVHNPWQIQGGPGPPPVPKSYLSAKHDFGAVGDGSEDDTQAIQDLAEASSEEGVPGLVESGLYKVSSQVMTPTNCDLRGVGMGATTFKIDAAMSLTAALFANPTIPAEFYARTDANIHLSDFAVNGAGRVWDPYLFNPATRTPVTNPASNMIRNPDWATHGYVFNFRKATGVILERLWVYDHGELTTMLSGCMNVRVLNCRFERNGRDDTSATVIHVKNHGTMKKITGISNAADAVITTDSQVGTYTAGDTLYIEGVQGVNVPDGEYVAKTVTGKAVITIERDTSAMQPFKDTGRARVARSSYAPAEDIVIDGCFFRNNKRQSVGLIASHQGVVSNCYSENSGECGVFALRSDDAKIINNTFKGVKLTDISGHCIEANLTTDLLIQGNLFEDAALAGFAHFGGYGTRYLDNVIRNCAWDPTITYPYGPDAENYTDGANYPNATPKASNPTYQAGEVVIERRPEEFSTAQISSFYDFPIKALRIAGNRIINDPVNPPQLSGFTFRNAGTGLISEAITIDHNDFTESELPGDTRIDVGPSFLKGVGELMQHDNFGLVGAYVDRSVKSVEYGNDYRTLYRTSAQVTGAAHAGPEYLMTASSGTELESGVITVQGAGQRGIWLFYFTEVDCAFPSSISPYLRIRANWVIGAAPNVTSNVKLYPVTVSTGGIITLGTPILTAASPTLAAGGVRSAVSPLLAAPADGPYALGCTVNGVPANIFDIQAQVQVKGVAE